MAEDLFGVRSLRSVVAEALAYLESRPKHRDDLVTAVLDMATHREFETWSGRALRRDIFNSAKSSVKDAGRNAVYAVEETVAPLRLFSFEEFEAVAELRAQQSVEAEESVYALQVTCNEVHGRTFDAEAILNKYRKAS